MANIGGVFGPAFTIAIVTGAWAAFALLCRWMLINPRGDELTGWAWLVLRAYLRLAHRVRVEGREMVPGSGPLIVVANHTAGIDPLVVQSGCAFEIRWMMGRGMMPAGLNALWDFLGVIPVEESGRDSNSLREALRHLKNAGILGIFPEGGIERPPGMLREFHAGVGLLALKSGAPVLPAVISGTPRADAAVASFLMTSHARVRFLPVRTYDKATWNAAAVAESLREEMARALGWPLSAEAALPDAEPGRATPG